MGNSGTGPYARAAALWRRAGWLGVLPVIGKDTGLPVGVTGKQGAWPTLDQINSWVQTRGQSNISIRLPEDVIGIDVDTYYDGMRHRVGAETMSKFEIEYGSLPQTYMSSARPFGTGSGIYLFQVPNGIDWVSDLGSDSDVQIIRYAHRYMVTWPSVHPNGSEYCLYGPDGSILCNGSTPDALLRIPRPTDLPELPSAWVGALTRARWSDPGAVGAAAQAALTSYSGRATPGTGGAPVPGTRAEGAGAGAGTGAESSIDPELMLFLGAPSGEQNNFLFKYVCSLRSRKFSREEMIVLAGTAVSRMQNSRPEDPWMPDDVIRMVDRIIKTYSPGSSREQALGVVTSSEREWALGVVNAQSVQEVHTVSGVVNDSDNISGSSDRNSDLSNDNAVLSDDDSLTVDSSLRLPEAPASEQLIVSELLDLPPRRVGEGYPLTATLSGPMVGGAYASIASDEDATEAGNAQRFARLFKDTFRYVPEWKTWIYINDNGRWKKDTDDRALYATLAVTEDIRGNEASDANQNQMQRDMFRLWMQKSRNTRPRKDLLKAASLIPELIISEQQLDTNPFLIGHEDGTVIELLTYVDESTHNAWRLRPIAPEDNITMSINYKFDPNATSKIWDNFIRFVLPEYEVRSYAQTAEGYCLQAHNPKRKWLVIYGQTTTGKTTFTETISRALGDYCKSSNHSIFNEVRGSKPRPDILNIFKARRAMISETSTHITLEASSIKRMTGNTSIAVRGNFSNTYTDAVPDCTIVLDCNDFPTILGIDGPTRDRTLVIPFKHQMLNIKDKRKSERMFNYVTYLQSLGDPDSAQEALQKFDDEEKESRTQTLSSVMHWLLDGWTYTVMGRLDNLETNMPEQIKQETMDAHSKMLVLNDFVEDMCVIDSESFEPISRLFIAYQIWMRKNGITKGDPAFLNSNSFARALTDAKYIAEKRTVTLIPSGESKQVRVRSGIRLTDTMRKEIMFHEAAQGIGDI